MAKVTLYASNFTSYGTIRNMKSTLEFLTKDAGHIFVFVNDPLRDASNIKVRFGDKDTYVGKVLGAKAINDKLAKLVDIHK